MTLTHQKQAWSILNEDITYFEF